MRSRLRPVLLAGMVAGALLAPTVANAISGGDVVADGTDRFVAKISMDGAACTGALIDPQWVITAASCFPAAAIQQGRPATLATVVVGQPNLQAASRHLLHVTALVGRTDRDVVLAKLTYPVTDITPLPIAAGAPTMGEITRVDGFGRTAADWVPDRLATTQFTVGAATATTVALANSAGHDPCKGDAGGPLIRDNAGRLELAGLVSLSWQHGCQAVTETRQGAIAARTDDIGGWITQQVQPKTTRVINRNSKLCLAVQGQNNVNDAPAFQFDCPPGYDDQTWDAQPAASGGVMLQNHNTKRCLIVHAGNNTVGSPALQYDCQPQFGDQFWDLVPAKGGVQIRNRATNRCLDVAGAAAGATAVQVDCEATHDDQIWDLNPAPERLHVQNRGSKLCLAVQGQNNVNDAPAFQFDCPPAYEDQAWQVDPAATGGFSLRNHYTNRCLVVHFDNNANGTPAVQVDCAPQFGDQLWDLATARDGVQIRNRATNRCLMVTGPAAGAAAAQVDCDATHNDQIWDIIPFP